MPYELISFLQAAGINDFLFIGGVVLLWLLVFLYNMLLYFRLAFYKIPVPGTEKIPVTVLMVERNEEANLAKNLPGWLSMGYGTYDMVVVDDFSEDNSMSVIGTHKAQYPRLKFTGLSQETRYSQKLSRNLALKAATYENVVFALPSMEMPAPQWFPAIAGAFSRNKEVVVGYSGIIPAQGFYHQLYRIESFYQQVESMAFCLNGLPYVVVEENISFRKEAYFNINGFAGRIRDEYLNMELIFNQLIRRRKNAVLPSGTLALRREMMAEKQEFNELLFKFFRLRHSLGFWKRAVSGFYNFLKMVYLPVMVFAVILYPVLWLALLVLLLLSAFFQIIAVKQLLKRLQEPKIFVPSLIYGIISPYYKMVCRGRYNFRQKRTQ